jgi:hypothetical protein
VPSTAFWLIPVGAVLFGALFVSRGVRALASDRERRESWLTFPGRVVGSRTVSSGFDGTTSDPTQCQVAYIRNGHEIVFWNRFTSTTTFRSPVGRPVEVLVNPADPGDAVVSRGLATGGTRGAILILAGAAFAILGVVFGLSAFR